MTQIVIHRHDHVAARADWRGRTQAYPRPRQKRSRSGAHSKSTSVRIVDTVNAGKMIREFLPVRIRAGVAGGRIGNGAQHATRTNPARIVKFLWAYGIPRTPFANSALHDANQARSGFAIRFYQSFRRFVDLVHNENLSEGVQFCPPKVFPKPENVVPRVI